MIAPLPQLAVNCSCLLSGCWRPSAASFALAPENSLTPCANGTISTALYAPAIAIARRSPHNSAAHIPGALKSRAHRRQAFPVLAEPTKLARKGHLLRIHVLAPVGAHCQNVFFAPPPAASARSHRNMSSPSPVVRIARPCG